MGARAVFVLAALALGPPLAIAAEAQPLPAKIIVASDKDYPPYSFLDSSGKLVGIVPDQWTAWSKATGIPVEIRGYSWAEAQIAFEAREADVLDTVFETPERKRKYDFTPVYATIEVPVFIHKSISGIQSVADLTGFHVAVKGGDASADLLAAFGKIPLDFYSNYEDIAKAAARLETRAFCIDKPPALYYLYKLGADRDFRIAFTLQSGAFHRAVLKGREDLLRLVEGGFASVPKSVYAKIDRVWLGSPLMARLDMRLVGIVVGALLVLLVASSMIVWALRKKVAAATAQLREKVALLEESEAKNRAFIAALPDLFFVFDKEGRCVDFSASDESKLAFPPSSFVGKKLAELDFEPALVAEFMDKLAATLATRRIERFYYDLPMGADVLRYEGRLVPLPGERGLLVSRNVTELRAKEEELSRSLAEKEVLLKEIHHRVKNNMQVISSLLSLQSGSFRDDEDRRLLSETQGRIRALATLHELLYDSPDLASICVVEYLYSLASALAAAYARPPVEIEGPPDLRLRIDEALPLGLIANELLSNAMKYAYSKGERGRIRVMVSEESSSLRFSVEDWGVGLAEGLDPEASPSMGFLLVRSLASQIGASLSFGGPPGLRVELVLPEA